MLDVRWFERVGMERKAYKTDLTDAQCLVIKPLIPPAKKGGRRRTVDIREILGGHLNSFPYWMLVGNDTT